MIVNDRRLECDHLGLLSRQPRTPRHTAESYWSTGGNWFMSSLQCEHFGPSSFYRLEPVSPVDSCGTQQLSVFFLCYASAITLKQSLAALELQPKTDAFDKSIRRHEKNESSYAALANIFCTIPAEKLDAVKQLLKKRSFTQTKPAHPPFRQQLMSRDDTQQQGHAHIMIFRQIDNPLMQSLGLEPEQQYLLTLSFDYNLFPEAMIAATKKHLNLEPIAGSTDTNLTFHYYSKLKAPIDDVIQDSAYFIADFIAILNVNQIDGLAEYVEKSKVFRVRAPQKQAFFKAELTDLNLGLVIEQLIQPFSK